MTTGVDSFTGTEGDDVIKGVFGDAVNSNNTLNPGDTIDGKGGKDTLELIASGNTASPVASISNVENIVIKDTVGATFTATTVSDAEQIKFTDTIAGQTSTINNLADTAIAGALSGKGNLTVNYTAGVLSGQSDAVKVNLDNVGASNAASTVTVSNNNAVEKVVVNGTGTNYFSINAGTGATTIELAGDGQNTVTGITAASSLSIDASAATGKQDITLAGLGLGDNIKGGQSTDDVLRTTLTNTATSLPTVSGFENVAVAFNAAGTFNASRVSDIKNLIIDPSGAAATVTSLAQSAQTLTFGQQTAINAGANAITVGYVSGSNSDVTMKVGASSTTSNPAVTIGNVTLTGNSGALTIESVGDAANTMGTLTANNISGLTIKGVDQNLTVGNTTANNAGSVTVDGSAKNTTVGTLAVDESLTSLTVKSGSGTAILGNVTQTSTGGSINTTYTYTGGAQNLTAGSVTATVAGTNNGTNLNADIVVSSEGAGAVTVGALSFTGAGNATSENTNVKLTATAKDQQGSITIAGLTVNEGSNQTSTTDVTLTGDGGAVTLTALTLTDSDTNTITLAANSSNVTLTTLTDTASTKTDITVTAAQGQSATIGTLAGTGNLNSITASGDGTIVLFGNTAANTSAVTSSNGIAVDATGTTGNFTVNLVNTNANVTVALGDAATGKTNTVFTGGGSDAITGGKGNDVISSGAGNDVITAGAGADQITGGAGNDTIDLGAGDNVADTVIFSAVANNGVDTISSFATGSDNLNVSALATLTGSGVAVASAATTSNTAVASNNAYIVTDEAATDWSDITTVIGNAIDESGAGSEKAVFIVDNGADARVYLYQNDGTDNQVQSGELTLVATLVGVDAAAITTTEIIV